MGLYQNTRGNKAGDAGEGENATYIVSQRNEERRTEDSHRAVNGIVEICNEEGQENDGA
jgi:hypothetical protein